LSLEWNRRVKEPLEPVIVEKGPCQERVWTSKDIDLKKLPVPVWNQADGGPYLTLSCHITKDPVTGLRNVGVYRNQLHDHNTLGILMEPYAHLRLQMAKAPGKPFPVAIVLGGDPVVLMTATAPIPFGVDELKIAGALRGKPLELVKCLTVPLEVPATAEIVIEGEILTDETREEGPFGEFTGYYGGTRAPRPVVKVKAITHREHPILHAIYEGKPPSGSAMLVAVPREAELMRQIALPGVKKVHMSPGGGGAFHAVISVEKPYEGFGKYVGIAVLGTTAGRSVKRVIVVDDDVDPFDPVAVEWAVATRVQAHRNIEIVREMPGVILDPSMPNRIPRLTSKMIIDATRYDAKAFPSVCLPAAEAMEKVEREWERYGIAKSPGKKNS
jgi:UbiD family decarboxylase